MAEQLNKEKLASQELVNLYESIAVSNENSYFKKTEMGLNLCTEILEILFKTILRSFSSS